MPAKARSRTSMLLPPPPLDTVPPPQLDTAAARIAENAPEPFDREVTMCDQLSAYLRKFVVSLLQTTPAVPSCT